MNRRTFLTLSAFGTAAAVMPSLAKEAEEPESRVLAEEILFHDEIGINAPYYDLDHKALSYCFVKSRIQIDTSGGNSVLIPWVKDMNSVAEKNEALMRLLAASSGHSFYGPRRNLVQRLDQAVQSLEVDGFDFGQVVTHPRNCVKVINDWDLKSKDKKGRLHEYAIVRITKACPKGTIFVLAPHDYVGVYAERGNRWAMGVLNSNGVAKVAT